jgi:DNA polymerase III sliding clamp (beta) subunit (PCNA family)
MKIGVNGHYLLDVLSHMPDGAVELSFTNPDSSILVQSTKDKNYQYLIMPMKL